MAAALDQVYPGPLAPLPPPIPFRPIPIVKGARKHRNKWALIIGIILDPNVDESDIAASAPARKRHSPSMRRRRTPRAGVLTNL
jgi:hypothetical protein